MLKCLCSSCPRSILIYFGSACSYWICANTAAGYYTLRWSGSGRGQMTSSSVPFDEAIWARSLEYVVFWLIGTDLFSQPWPEGWLGPMQKLPSAAWLGWVLALPCRSSCRPLGCPWVPCCQCQRRQERLRVWSMIAGPSLLIWLGKGFFQGFRVAIFPCGRRLKCSSTPGKIGNARKAGRYLGSAVEFL